MIVLDATAWVVALVDRGRAGDECRAELSADRSWMAPAHMPSEALRTVRRFETAGLIEDRELDQIVEQIATAAIQYALPDAALLTSQWKLRHNLSAYDAPYVVLGLRYRSALITLDKRLGRAAEALGVEVKHVRRD